MSKRNSLNREKIIKKGEKKRKFRTSGRKKEQEHWEERVRLRKKYINTISLPSPLEYSKLYLMAETKIITLSNMVLNTHRRNS